MDGRTEIGAVKEDLEGLTVSELVTLLKSAFENAYFTLVEEVLVSREEKLKAEMEGKNRENELLLEKLQRFKKESREMKELVTRLKEERDVLLNIMKENEDDKKEIIELKRKNCELECAKLNAETELDVYRGTIKEDRDELLKRTRENDDLKKEIIELKRKNCDLECAELNAETEMGVNKGILKGINERLLSLEKDLGMVRTLEEVDVTIEDPFVNLPLDTNAVEEETKMFDSAEKLLSETNPNPSRGSSHRKRTDIVEIFNSNVESSSLERDSRVKVEEPVPFASVEHCSPAPLNLKTHSIGKGETSANMSKRLRELLSELGDESSSSSSSDDELDLSIDYSTLYKTLD